jgi:serine/threonine-protein kinase
MRWNPFRREDSAARSNFESTVVATIFDDALSLVRGSLGVDSPAGGSGERPAGGRSLARSESIGHVGRYALKKILGKGGLGTVYAAWDPLLSRTVALKTLHLDADPAERRSFDAMFLHEARAAGGLSHPHIVTVFDAGLSDAGVYIAMERLHGQDLRRLLAQGTRPGPFEAAQVVRRIADALAYAHRRGVIHCDIKPANIFMTGRMNPKVLDFGIARIAHRDMPAQDGPAAGSPFYLAPEQVEGRAVDRRSDVYSLGVVLYEMLTGKRPFEGRTLENITAAVTAGHAVPAHRVSSKVPLALSAIASRAMSRDPAQRYPSARHLSLELRHWLDSSEASALRNRSRGKGVAPRRWLPDLRVAAPLCALGIAAVLVLGWIRIRPASTPAPTVAAIAVHTATPRPLPASAPAVAQAAAPATTTPASAAEVAPEPPRPSAAVAGLTLSPDAMPAAPAAAATATAVPDVPRAASRPQTRAEARAELARQRQAAIAAGAAPATAPAADGVVQLAVSPWGQVEVDGRPMGISPPLARLTLPAGSHTITIRNADFPSYSATLTVGGQEPVMLRHRFGP